MIRVLLTGFGPFPGAPKNPTAALVARLARRRCPALHDVRIATHVFATSYAAVDRDLPALLARHRPEVLLMFGLASRTPFIRIETRARNALAAFRDVESARPRARSIATGAYARRLPFRLSSLLPVLHGARVPVRLSRDAGAYLCNYLCWRAAEAAQQTRVPHCAAFVHVPKLASRRFRAGGKRRIVMEDLVAFGMSVLAALVAQARRP